MVALQAEIYGQMDELGLAPREIPEPEMASFEELNKWAAESGLRVHNAGALLAITICGSDRRPRRVFYVSDLDWDEGRIVVAYEIYRSRQCFRDDLDTKDWQDTSREAVEAARKWAVRFAPDQAHKADDLLALLGVE